ncbi:hypothetical protein E2C01_008929 [Portunus trituberculatus]|uniref:Uncharacterized protein n=1 Tax=Portunus trituberculatus TaxID=210409 RepID=A0A5B7D237_PORTR|nr:hypothetical protein [Portunus trituberculatus]
MNKGLNDRSLQLLLCLSHTPDGDASTLQAQGVFPVEDILGEVLMKAVQGRDALRQLLKFVLQSKSEREEWCRRSNRHSNITEEEEEEEEAVPVVGLVEAAISTRPEGTRPVSALRHLQGRFLVLQGLAQRRDAHLLLCYLLTKLEEREE